MKNTYSDKEIEFIKNEYPKHGLDYCVSTLNKEKYSIKAKVATLNLHKNRHVNFEQFENITTKEVAYILGLLWADGHIAYSNNNAKTPIIKHSSKPDDNIYFLKTLNEIGKWNTFQSVNKGSFANEKKLINTNWISDRKIGDYLIEHDYKNKLKSPEKILNKIPDDLRVYWFRGFFDGDGSVTIKNKGHHSIAFTGHAEQDWAFIIQFFKKIKIENFKYRIIMSRGGRSSQIRVSNKKDLLKFENYLYFDYDIYELGLLRKRIQFKDL